MKTLAEQLQDRRNRKWFRFGKPYSKPAITATVDLGGVKARPEDVARFLRVKLHLALQSAVR